MSTTHEYKILLTEGQIASLEELYTLMELKSITVQELIANLVDDAVDIWIDYYTKHETKEDRAKRLAQQR